MAGITVIGYVIADRFTGGFLHDGFVRIFSRTKPFQAHSREHLKFGIRSSRTYRRHGEVSALTRLL